MSTALVPGWALHQLNLLKTNPGVRVNGFAVGDVVAKKDQVGKATVIGVNPDNGLWIGEHGSEIFYFVPLQNFQKLFFGTKGKDYPFLRRMKRFNGE